jgi:hypothetical protein
MKEKTTDPFLARGREQPHYEEYLMDQAVLEAERDARYQAHVQDLADEDARFEQWLQQQAEQECDIAVGLHPALTPMHGAALKLVRKYNWKSFPANLENGEKKSYLKGENTPEKLNWGMTSNLFHLENNFCGHYWKHKCGIGVPTGAVNNIFVVEADTPKGHNVDGLAALKRLETEHEPLPETLMAETPSGSVHRYYKHPGAGLKVVSRKLAGYDGIDIKGDGGMVIAPPSKRADGEYRWLNDLPIAEAPDWLLDLVIQPDNDSKSKDTNSSKAKSNGAAGGVLTAEMSADEAAAAYAAIPNDDCGWDEWNEKGMAGWRATAGEGFAGFDSWSQKSSKYNAHNTIEKWMKYFSSPPTEIGAGSLIMWANEGTPGWREAYRAKVYAELAVSSAQPERVWPTLESDALYGLAGEVVRLFEPHTEADPVALLIQFLIYFGNAIDRGVYYLVEDDRHHANLFAVLVGDTSKSRKGTSAGRIRALMSTVDTFWSADCIKGGLSSGEGLVWEIRDAVTKLDKESNEVTVVDAVADKRLLLDEREFFQALVVAKREGNTVSRIIRDAWDGRPLIFMTKSNPARCVKPHISIAGHITSAELKREMDETAMANGYANRFLFACVRRSKLLPHGGNVDPKQVVALAGKIKEVFSKHYVVEKQITMDAQARVLWTDIYAELSEGKPGMLGAITARAEAQTIRLALLYALLDGSDLIRVEHLKAGLAVWKYCEASAAHVFGDALGDRVADEILRALRANGGMSRTDLHDLFGRNLSASKIGAALVTLLNARRVRRETPPSSERGGRPKEMWFPI